MTSTIQSAPFVGASSQESESSSEPPSASTTRETREPEPEPDPIPLATAATLSPSANAPAAVVPGPNRPNLQALDGGLLEREIVRTPAKTALLDQALIASSDRQAEPDKLDDGHSLALSQAGQQAEEKPAEKSAAKAVDISAEQAIQHEELHDAPATASMTAPEIVPETVQPSHQVRADDHSGDQTAERDQNGGSYGSDRDALARPPLSDRSPASSPSSLVFWHKVLVITKRLARTLAKVLSRLPRPELRWHNAANGEEEHPAMPESHSDAAETGAVGNAAELLLLDNIRALRTARVEDVRVPRADITFITNDMSLDDIVAKAKDAGHSRFPVIGDSQDEVLGMIHIKDLLWGDVDQQAFRVQDFMRDVLFVAPSMPVLQLLQDMQVKRHHMALIVDEFGGIDGLVTIEDLVEEIVGDISDEYDTDREPALVPQTDGTWIIDARYRIDELEELIGGFLTADEQEEDIDTLGGLLTHIAGRVPTRNELIEHASGMRFQVVDADPRRIKRLRMRAKSLAGAKGLVSQARDVKSTT